MGHSPLSAAIEARDGISTLEFGARTGWDNRPGSFASELAMAAATQYAAEVDLMTLEAVAFAYDYEVEVSASNYRTQYHDGRYTGVSLPSHWSYRIRPISYDISDAKHCALKRAIAKCLSGYSGDAETFEEGFIESGPVTVYDSPRDF